MPLRIIFMGTAPLAAASLEGLRRVPDVAVVAVVTQPDRPKGRDLALQPSAVKVAAQAAGLPVLQPEKARDPAFIEDLRWRQPDLIVVAAYGQILPRAILELPRHRCLNVHASLLPRWRGAAPIQWAILSGDAETGVTIMLMDEGLDTGAMVAKAATPIGPQDTGQTLHDRLAGLGAELLVATIPGFVRGELTPQAQPAEGVTYARKISKEDGRLDWHESAANLERRWRAFTPWPGVFTWLPGGTPARLLKVHELEVAAGVFGKPGEVLQADKTGILVACGTGAVRLLRVQKEGGRRLTAAEFLAGHPLPAGARFPVDAAP